MLNFFRRTIIATHNGGFHADDAFAVAVLRLMLTINKSQKAGNVLVVRTREEEKISQADYVVDVGRQYNPTKKRFDHHQHGGAGERKNGIPYAAFGLVWKEYGSILAQIILKKRKIDQDSLERILQIVDQKLVQPIDAGDNGVSIVTEKFEDIRPYDISAIIAGINPEWNEKADSDDQDERFLTAVSLAEDILVKEIQSAANDIEAENKVLSAYRAAPDKRLIVLDQYVPSSKTLSGLPEPLFVVYPEDGQWRIKAIRRSFSGFENRKDLPETWAGKSGDELARAIGVPGATFCHNKRFIAAAKTREAILTMAKLAIES